VHFVRLRLVRASQQVLRLVRARHPRQRFLLQEQVLPDVLLEQGQILHHYCCHLLVR
jgi:hypothetical protein